MAHGVRRTDQDMPTLAVAEPEGRVDRSQDSGGDSLRIYLRQLSERSPDSIREEEDETRELETLRAEFRRDVFADRLGVEAGIRLIDDVLARRRAPSRVFTFDAQDAGIRERLLAELPARAENLRRILSDPGALRRGEAARHFEEPSLQFRRVLELFAVLEEHGANLEKASRVQLRKMEKATGCSRVEFRKRLRRLSDLLRRYQVVKNRLCTKNLRLVVSIGKKYVNRGLPFLDLIQEGNAGLMRALDKFEASRGFRFSTYATWWIRQGMSRAIEEQSRTIRIPSHINETVNRLKKQTREFRSTMGRDPSVDEASDLLGMEPSELTRILEVLRSPVSLDQPVGSTSHRADRNVADLIEDPSSESPAVLADHEMLRSRIEEVLDSLPARSRRVVELRYGLRDGQVYTLDEVGRLFNITRERVRQIQLRAVQLLQKPTQRMKLAPFNVS